MNAPRDNVGAAPVLRFIIRLAAISLLWLVAAGIAAACLLPQGGISDLRTDEDWAALRSGVVFASSLAIAGAVALFTCLTVVGQRRRALEAICGLALTVAVLSGGVYTFLWIDPWLVRSHMGGHQFVRLQQTTFYLAQDIAKYELPLASVVGLVVGTTAGLVALSLRRWPRVAITLLATALVAGKAASLHESALDLVIGCGHIVRRLLDSPGMTDAFVPAWGAVSGAILGAVLAIILMWPQWKRTRVEPTAAA
jgi:hypothetical protein